MIKVSTRVVFIKTKKLFNIYDINVTKILVSKKDSYGKIAHLNTLLNIMMILSLCIKLPQMTGYVKCFDSNKTMSSKVNNNRLLKKYTKLREKISSSINIEFDSKPIYGDHDKYLKTKKVIWR